MAAGIGIGLLLSDEAAARTGTPVPVGKAFMFNDEYRPGARFRVVSPVIDETPDVEGVQNQDLWAGADTRIVEYLNTGERVSLFPIEQADIQEGTVYGLSSHTLSIFDRAEGIVTCEYHYPDSDAGAFRRFRREETMDGGGVALISASNFYPGARFRVVSDVIDWTPLEDVKEDGSDRKYNTRYGEYLNANDEFLFYPTRSASVARGSAYRMRDTIEVVDSAEALLSVEFDRVNDGGSAREDR